MTDLTVLRQVATAARDGGKVPYWYSEDRLREPDHPLSNDADIALIAACSPDVVLELLDRLEAAEAASVGTARPLEAQVVGQDSWRPTVQGEQP